MTASSQTQESSNGKIQVRDAGRFIEFTGELIGQVSTRTLDEHNQPVEPRWLEIELYKITAGTRTGSYVAHIIGRSDVYHTHMSRCNRGVPEKASELFTAARPCTVCAPPRFGQHDDPDKLESVIVDMESDRHTTYVCESADEVVERLRVPNRRRPKEPGIITAPVMRLLDTVSLVDPAIAKAAVIVERL